MADIKWLLVDIGDVLLLKNRELGPSFTELLAEELSLDSVLAQEINKAHYTTMESKFVSEEDFVKYLKVNVGYDAPGNIYSYFSRAYKKQVRPNREFLDFLNEIRKTGIKTAVLSNTIAIYQHVQEEAGISKVAGFDPIFYSWQVGMIKPHIDIFELALKELKAQSNEVAFIDDKSGHLEGARSVGMQTVLFDTTENAISKIRELINKPIA